MTTVRPGDNVVVEYTGRLEDGQVFATTEGREPFEFVIGGRDPISGFQNAVLGMEVGESKSVCVEPEDGYGLRREDRVFPIDRSKFPTEPPIGQPLELKHPGGDSLKVVVIEVWEASVLVDANHPLAGRRLQFEISVLKINRPGS